MAYNQILAFSSSRVGHGGYLQAVAPLVIDFLGDKKQRIAFVPFASVADDGMAYLEMVKAGLNHDAYILELVERNNAKQLLQDAEVIVVGGGNTFKLLHDIYEFKLLDLIRDRVNAGVPYIGWSAGANLLGPTIGTTNDMPIIEPKSLNALGLFPFQINPHYHNGKPAGHNGETRDQRLQEFLQLNPGVPILALPEGSALQMKDNKLQAVGSSSVSIFTMEEHEMQRREMVAGSDLSFLL